jgi:hypothetical protein
MGVQRGESVKDATIITLAGYTMATIIVCLMLYTDGPTAAATAALVAGTGAGIGTYVGKKTAGA